MRLGGLRGVHLAGVGLVVGGCRRGAKSLQVRLLKHGGCSLGWVVAGSGCVFLTL